MEIEDLMKSIGLDYKIIEETKNVKIIKVMKKVHIYFIKQNNNQFIVDRDIFEYLESNSIPYCILLKDVSQNKTYLLALRKGNNWVKSCFKGCDKEKIYLGKQVLNAQVTKDELVTKLSKYK